MRVLVVLALAVAVVCGNPERNFRSAAASVTRNTPQEQWLAKQNTGNFACKVDQVVVKVESPPSGPEIINKDDLRDSFANTASIEWAHIPQTSFTPLDGRNDEKSLGTPGGDMGEFIQAIHALGKVSGRDLTPEEIQDGFEKYIRVMTREKFSYQTDEKAYTRLAVNTGCKNLRIAEMGGLKRKKEAVLAQIAKPEHIGDPFIKFLAQNATGLDMSPEYIQSCLAAYHNVLWSSPSPASQKLCYLSLKGPHKEAALVNVEIPDFCIDQGLAPMVSPALTCASPVLINHPGAVKILRREIVSVLVSGFPDVDPRDVLAAYNTLAEDNLEKFWSSFGKGLATFKVSFKKQVGDEEPRKREEGKPKETQKP